MSGHRKIGVLLAALGGARGLDPLGRGHPRGARRQGHDAAPIFVDRDIDLVLRQTRIDVAFLALHGATARRLRPGLLECWHPYTGSGVLASGWHEQGQGQGVLPPAQPPDGAGYVIQADSGEDVIESHGRSASRSSSSPRARLVLGIKIARDELELEAAVEERCASTTTSSSSAS